MSTANLLTPPPAIPPSLALTLSQKSPHILSRTPLSSLPWPFSLLLSTETPATWTIHENAFFSSLRTGDDASARALLARLEDRFGSTNERIVTLRGVYNEASAKSDAELETVLKGYDKIIAEDATNIGIRKRRVAVLKALGRTGDAVKDLAALLTDSPTDIEAWAEASELYASLGAWGQAVFCAEEVLLVVPNSWDAHSHLATLHHSSTLSQTPPSLPSLSLSLKHFSRAAELNASSLRAWYGIKLLTSKLIPLLPTSSSSAPSKRNVESEDDIPIPGLETVKGLEELATRKLGEIVRRCGAGEKGWTGFDAAEVTAARELLGKAER